MGSIRVFSSRLSPRARRVYAVLLVYFLVVSASLLWPIYTLFASARPLILGLPLSLFFLTVVLLASFGVLLGLYRWEDRSGALDEEE